MGYSIPPCTDGVTATEYDTHFYGPSAAVYRAGVQTIFGGRAAIAAWLFANGY